LADEEQPAGPDPTLADVVDAIRQIEVGQFLVSTVSTMASLAYGKLETGDVDQAKAAVDAVRALLPVLEGRVDEALLRDFRSALSNLEIAYADAVARAQ
jgi:hypothetical protein